MTNTLDWFFGEAEERFAVAPSHVSAAVSLPCGAAAEMDGAENEGWPLTIEAELAGREFARKYLNEVGAEWVALEEPLALRLLACSAYDVPAVIAAMEQGNTFRTRFAEYRLVK